MHLYTESPTYDVPRPHPPESGHTHTPPTLHVSSAPTAAPNNLDDDARLLELLGDDDEDDDELLAALSSSPTAQDTVPLGLPAGREGTNDYENSFNEKLRQLRSSLKEDIEGRDKDTGSGNGNMDNESPEYENVKQNKSQTSVDPSTGVPDSEQSSYYQNIHEFDLETNESYSMLSSQDRATQLADSADPVEEDGSLYENNEEIESYILEQQHKKELSHTYEQLDQVFESHDHKGVGNDIPDGGGFSRPCQPPTEHLEMEELVIFKNLPTLICRSHLGDESSMTKLADTANSVLKEAVRVIHSTVGKLLPIKL